MKCDQVTKVVYSIDLCLTQVLIVKDFSSCIERVVCISREGESWDRAGILHPNKVHNLFTGSSGRSFIGRLVANFEKKNETPLLTK